MRSNDGLLDEGHSAANRLVKHPARNQEFDFVAGSVELQPYMNRWFCRLACPAYDDRFLMEEWMEAILNTNRISQLMSSVLMPCARRAPLITTSTCPNPQSKS
jgi:hypothetical protein